MQDRLVREPGPESCGADAAHMVAMKITAYMNLNPQHIHLDLTTGAVSMDGSARRWDMDVYPSVEAAAAARHSEESSTYTVTTDIPDGSVFEVRGEKDQTEGRLGSYVAGLFDNYPAAYEAAAGLGVMGRRGDVFVRLAPASVFSSAEEWKRTFDRDTCKTFSSSPFNLRTVVELAADDGQARGAANPEYAVWVKLNEKFGPKAGVSA